MTLDQDICTFDVAAFRVRIAAMMGVSESRVQVSAEAGSVTMTALVQADGQDELASVLGTLNALTLTSASDDLGATVLRIDTVAQAGELTPSPSLRRRQTRRPSKLYLSL
jgi:hypothetical protein